MNDVIASLDVSRETAARLHLFADILTKWNARINLVAPATLSDLWVRHIQDSAQIFALAPEAARHWVDLGTGGGLPGLICAVLAAEQRPDCRFTLIESDQRKAAFLMTATRELGLRSVITLPQRIDAVTPLAADIVSARALAPLPALLPMVARHCAAHGVSLLPKGKDWMAEVQAARAGWQFALTAHPSQTDAAARVLQIKELTRV